MNVIRLNLFVCAALAAFVVALPADADEFPATALPFLRQFCFDCHAETEAAAGLDLARMASESSLEATFKNWQKVVAVLQQGKMPPRDMPQPTISRRDEVLAEIQAALSRAMDQHAGDPGEVLVRRLTAAEYAYALQDLTGLALDLPVDSSGDGVGGEGFTNTGSAQFVQDSTLERYLESAKRIASHAVIGTGPLAFYRDPGQTGMELSAIHRIQEIYRRYGFRTAAGEGGLPYGLDRYPKAFFAAWRYRHREALGVGGVSLASLAAQEGLQPKFAEHVWSAVSGPTRTFPSSEIIFHWQQLPQPVGTGGEAVELARTGCEALYGRLLEWQTRLAAAVGDEEEAAVLSEASLNVAKSHSFTARILWPPDTKKIRVQFAVISGLPDQTAQPVVIWRNPRIRLRTLARRREELQPLKGFLPAEVARQFGFGMHPAQGSVSPEDFVTQGPETRHFDLAIPDNLRGVEILVDVQLDLEHGEDGVARCEISGGNLELPLKAASASLIADPEGSAVRTWKSGVLEFARLFPQVSHREPAPSDRDPIPAPFVNTYNMPERNFFHTKVKYHRDDAFLVEMMLDEVARRRLDEAWHDLLSSFEYHDVLTRFVATKYQLDLGERTIETLEDAWLAQVSDECREYLVRWRAEYRAIQGDLKAAEPKHLADIGLFAQRAWRRPLTSAEREGLSFFYDELRSGFQLSHADAIRAVLVRILMSPSFLYRAEVGSDANAATDVPRRTDPQHPFGDAPLTNWELASRLSFFLWSSVPDEELSQAAAAGTLRNPDELSRHARRMLRDPRARRLATEFFGQWLGFYQFDRWRGVDTERFPEFTDSLRTAMYEEAIAFCEHIVRQDRPVTELLFADYGFLNQELADHYGIAAKVGRGIVSRVGELDRNHRGGLLSLGAILTMTSAPLRTSPVKRGDWVLRRVLGTAVPPPPADAGSIPADDVLPSGPRTVRERLEAHRREASCTNCHSRIDPLGFALEHFDSVGRWRESYRDGATIDSSGTLNDGTEIIGVEGLQNYLRTHQAQFRRTFCVKLLGYALGRGESIGDQRLIADMLASAARGNDSLSMYVEKLVTSRPFRYHRIRLEPSSEENRASDANEEQHATESR